MLPMLDRSDIGRKSSGVILVFFFIIEISLAFIYTVVELLDFLFFNLLIFFQNDTISPRLGTGSFGVNSLKAVE